MHFLPINRLLTRSLLNETLKSMRIDGVREALGVIERACFAEGRQINRYDDFLKGTDIPTLIIIGGKDEIIPAPEVADVSVIQEAGHMLQLEAAGEVNRQITDFLIR